MDSIHSNGFDDERNYNGQFPVADDRPNVTEEEETERALMNKILKYRQVIDNIETSIRDIDALSSSHSSSGVIDADNFDPSQMIQRQRDLRRRAPRLERFGVQRGSRHRNQCRQSSDGNSNSSIFRDELVEMKQLASNVHEITNRSQHKMRKLEQNLSHLEKVVKIGSAIDQIQLADDEISDDDISVSSDNANELKAKIKNKVKKKDKVKTMEKTISRTKKKKGLNSASDDTDTTESTIEVKTDTNIFQNVMNAVMGAPAPTEPVTEEKIQNVFNEVDVDDSKLLSKKEFKEAVNKMNITDDAKKVQCIRRFDGLDTSGDGLLSFSEFRMAILGKKAEPIEPEDLKEVFDQLDVDNSKLLDLSEFKAACKYFKFGQNEDLEKYFKKVDEDNSGLIDFDEFVKAFTGKELTKKEKRDLKKT